MCVEIREVCFNVADCFFFNGETRLFIFEENCCMFHSRALLLIKFSSISNRFSGEQLENDFVILLEQEFLTSFALNGPYGYPERKLSLLILILRLILISLLWAYINFYRRYHDPSK